MEKLQQIIEAAFAQKEGLTPNTVDPSVRAAVDQSLAALDEGRLRVAEKIDNQWVTKEWLKKAIILAFRIQEIAPIDGGDLRYFDKMDLKFSKERTPLSLPDGIRVVPPATVRYGSFIAPNTILMPSFVNIGAYIDEGSMVDSWATVGSCAQIGRNVHLSGGVGIGGVLEPLQSTPTIIEDDCFIGARSEIVEGVVVESGSVLSMGVYIGQSTPIYDRDADCCYYGRVPAGSVVVPGSLPGKNGKYSLYCAIIVKQVDSQTRSKVSINQLLRESSHSYHS